jgi:post-segregation antitoxin (ccd killing protein)
VEYDEAVETQRLVRMIALCPACHEVKHIGLAGIKGRGDVARAHLAAVNGWTAAFASRYVDEAFAVWRARSGRAWSLDVSALVSYGIDPAIIAEASEMQAENRAQSASSATVKVQQGSRRSRPV